jgi:Arc/MetJ family transcription regulator
MNRSRKEKKAVESPVWLEYHTRMKMTMHIDESVLAEVMDITGAKTKTGAVEMALKEMARKSKLKKLLRAGMGLTPDEIKASFDFETYDRLNSTSGMVLSEKPKAAYGSKSRSRR